MSPSTTWVLSLNKKKKKKVAFVSIKVFKIVKPFYKTIENINWAHFEYIAAI